MSSPNLPVLVRGIYCFLLICVVVGGGFLVAYCILPEDPSRNWLVEAGLALGILPWAFWILTFFYRIVSRSFGFRMVCCCLGDDGGNDSVNPAGNVTSDQPPSAAWAREGGQPNDTNGGGAAMGGSVSGRISHESEIPLTSPGAS